MEQKSFHFIRNESTVDCQVAQFQILVSTIGYMESSATWYMMFERQYDKPFALYDSVFWRAVRSGHFEANAWKRRSHCWKAVGTPFPLLKCLRTPKCSLLVLQDFAYTISNFSVVDTPCMDSDTNIRLAHRRIVAVLRNDNSHNTAAVTSLCDVVL